MKWFIGIASLLLIFPAAQAGIIKMVVSQVSPAFGGRIFGPVGAYEKITGKAYGEIDPSLPANGRITDIQLAPRNARGMVEYSMDFYILKPIDLRKGNHKLFAEIPNRGGKLFGGFNNSSGGNDPGAVEEKGEGFLMTKGYTIVWCGWDISATSGNDNMTITVPIAVNKDGSPVTGPSYEYISFDNDHSMGYHLTYPAAFLVKDQALLTVRSLLNDPPQVIPPTGWEFDDEHHIHLLPAGTAFRQSAIYEFFYTAKDPLVAGLGLASTRDFISFLRHATADGQGQPNPLAGDIQYTFSFAISQPARYINDFEALGFNVDEEGQRVFDGVENWLGGAAGVGINYRFAQPGRTERNRQNHLYPESIFPFTYMSLVDSFTKERRSRYDGYAKTTQMPKELQINSANEYWVKAASLLHTDLQGGEVLEPYSVRYYLISGMQHGSGSGSSKGNCQQFQNPTRAEPVLRALFVALDNWVTKDQQPPYSEVPQLTRKKDAVKAQVIPGQLTGFVPKAALGWPDIPGVTYTGLITMRYRFDYGPRFEQGILDHYPQRPFYQPTYTCLVSKVDKDGNELAGIHLPPVAAPVATLTGWALRREGYGLNDGGESAGQQIPFAITKTQRLATGDPRLSLEERYGTHKKYVEAVTKAARDLEKRRLLLPEDVQKYIEEAEESKVLR